MEIIFAAVEAGNENRNILTIKAGEGETIKVGQTIPIMLTDETYVERKIEAMSKYDAATKKRLTVDSISSGETASIDVYDISGYVQTTSMPSPQRMREIAAMKNVMPFKEILGGEESIYDHIDENFVVPNKVIAYLQTTRPHLVCMGMYKHPFKDKDLLGPYWYTDGEYFWDRDAWKYVLKYHVTLPQEFIDKVMSEEGTAFLKKCEEEGTSWSKVIKEWKNSPNMMCLMPDDAGDCPLDDF